MESDLYIASLMPSGHWAVARGLISRRTVENKDAGFHVPPANEVEGR